MKKYNLLFVFLVSSCFPGGSGSSSFTSTKNFISGGSNSLEGGGPVVQKFTLLEDEEYTIDLSEHKIDESDVIFESESGVFEGSTYKPNKDFFGEDYIKVKSDGKEYNYIATVTPVNDSPITQPLQVTLIQGVAKTIDLSTNIADPDNDLSELRIEVVSSAQGIDQARVLPGGKIELRASRDKFGSSVIDLDIVDSGGLSSNMRVNLTVTDTSGNTSDSRIPVQCFYLYDKAKNQRLPYVGGSPKSDCESSIERLNQSLEVDGERTINLKYFHSEEIDDPTNFNAFSRSQLSVYSNNKGSDDVVNMFFTKAMAGGIAGVAYVDCPPGPTCYAKPSLFNRHDLSVPGKDIVLRHEMGHLFSAQHATANMTCGTENDFESMHRLLAATLCGERTLALQRCDARNRSSSQESITYQNKVFRYGNNVMRWMVYYGEEGFWNSGSGYTELYKKNFRCWQKRALEHVKSRGL